MENLDRLEIYIPVEAEVKSIPIRSLPGSVLRRMGLPLPAAPASRKLKESPEGIWICPAVLRRKGQKTTSHAGNAVTENISTQMSKEFRTAPGPFQMSFVSSNHAAYKVLKDTMPGRQVPANTSHTFPEGSIGPALQDCHDALVIYSGRIYLSIRKPARKRGQQEKSEPQPATLTSIPLKSRASSNGQNKLHPTQATIEPAQKKPQRKRISIPLPKKKDSTTHHASTEPTDKEPQKKRLRMPLPKTSPKKILPTNTDNHSTENRVVSSSKTAGSVPHSTDREDSHHHNDAGAELAAEKDVAHSESETQDLSIEEAVSPSQNHYIDSNIEMDIGDPNSSILDWTTGASQVAPSTSAQQECDFKELEQEEKIAQMMAKFRQSDAAINNRTIS